MLVITRGYPKTTQPCSYRQCRSVTSIFLGSCFSIGHFRKIFLRCDSLLEPGLVDQTWQKMGGMAQGHPGYSTTAAETDPAGKFVCVAEKLKETKTEVGVTNLLVQLYIRAPFLQYLAYRDLQAVCLACGKSRCGMQVRNPEAKQVLQCLALG